MELCGVNALNFAVGAYLPISTTLPIFAGGLLKKIVDTVVQRRGERVEDAEFGKGSLFATGLVAGGALAGVVVALISIPEKMYKVLQNISLEHKISAAIGDGGYQLLGVAFFVFMAVCLYHIATASEKSEKI